MSATKVCLVISGGRVIAAEANGPVEVAVRDYDQPMRGHAAGSLGSRTKFGDFARYEVDVSTPSAPHDEDLVLPVRAHSEDWAIDVVFEGAGYFGEVAEDAIIELARCGWAHDYPADDVLYGCVDEQPRAYELNEYCQLVDVGFEVVVDRRKTLSWLRRHRPGLARRLRREGL